MPGSTTPTTSSGPRPELAIYPGSIYLPCDQCKIEIAVGPRQQEEIANANRRKQSAMVLCMICAVEVAYGGPGGTDVASLGNPFVKEQHGDR